MGIRSETTKKRTTSRRAWDRQRNIEIVLYKTIQFATRTLYCVVSDGDTVTLHACASERQLIRRESSESRGCFGKTPGTSYFRRLFSVPTVRRAVPQALLCSSDVAFFDGQHKHKHKHAGTGAGRQEHAATHSPGRLDQEPRSTGQNGGTKVSFLRHKCRLISPHLCGLCLCGDLLGYVAVVVVVVFLSPWPLNSYIRWRKEKGNRECGN